MEFVDGYYEQVRADVGDLVQGRDLRVLDLGCAAGRLGAELKRRELAGTVDGIEVDPNAAAAAQSRIDRVWNASLDDFAFGDIEGTYDVIVAADILEHLVDPWRVLQLAVRHCLRPGGTFVGSFPNVRYLRVLVPLALRGRFDYKDSGVLDRTHLRFFTRHSIAGLVNGAGLDLDVIRPSPAAWRGRGASFAASLLRDLGAEQLLVRAHKPG